MSRYINGVSTGSSMRKRTSFVKLVVMFQKESFISGSSFLRHEQTCLTDSTFESFAQVKYVDW